jgi:hypothetical protein
MVVSSKIGYLTQSPAGFIKIIYSGRNLREVGFCQQKRRLRAEGPKGFWRGVLAFTIYFCYRLAILARCVGFVK